MEPVIGLEPMTCSLRTLPPRSFFIKCQLSADRIQAALNKWKVDTLPTDYYRFTDIDDEDLSKILTAVNIKIPQKLYRRGELKGLKSDMKIFM